MWVKMREFLFLSVLFCCSVSPLFSGEDHSSEPNHTKCIQSVCSDEWNDSFHLVIDKENLPFYLKEEDSKLLVEPLKKIGKAFDSFQVSRGYLLRQASSVLSNPESLTDTYFTEGNYETLGTIFLSNFVEFQNNWSDDSKQTRMVIKNTKGLTPEEVEVLEEYRTYENSKMYKLHSYTIPHRLFDEPTLVAMFERDYKRVKDFDKEELEKRSDFDPMSLITIGFFEMFLDKAVDQGKNHGRTTIRFMLEAAPMLDSLLAIYFPEEFEFKCSDQRNAESPEEKIEKNEPSKCERVLRDAGRKFYKEYQVKALENISKFNNTLLSSGLKEKNLNACEVELSKFIGLSKEQKEMAERVTREVKEKVFSALELKNYKTGRRIIREADSLLLFKFPETSEVLINSRANSIKESVDTYADYAGKLLSENLKQERKTISKDTIAALKLAYNLEKNIEFRNEYQKKEEEILSTGLSLGCAESIQANGSYDFTGGTYKKFKVFKRKFRTHEIAIEKNWFNNEEKLKSVLAHELGHFISYTVSMLKKKDDLYQRVAKARSCVNQRKQKTIRAESAYYGYFPGDSIHTEEDFADFVTHLALEDKNQIGCSLLDERGRDLNELTVFESMESFGFHSSSITRLLNSKLRNGVALPVECNETQKVFERAYTQQTCSY